MKWDTLKRKFRVHNVYPLLLAIYLSLKHTNREIVQQNNEELPINACVIICQKFHCH